MDFQILGQNSLKLKSKKVTLAVDPEAKISKFEADAVLLTDKTADLSRVNNYRIVINGPGEYEVAGLKMSGIKSDGGYIYELINENGNVLIARAGAVNKIPQDRLNNYKIIVLNADSELNQTAITAMEPSVVVLYGSLKTEGARKLGSSVTSESSKISISEEKLPEELEVVLLG